jgi:glutamyl-tRNA synthetase
MNTPKQILLYHALGAQLPVFAHVPMVLGKDRSRLSKRHGATSVTAYRDMGYLSEAFVNYLVRLGWSYGDQEYFTRDELIEKFTLDNIGRAAGIFDQEKLTALNADHIQASSPQSVANQLLPFLAEIGINVEPDDHLTQIVKTLIQRSKTLTEMAAAAEFYFAQEITYEPKAAKKFLKPQTREPLNLLLTTLENLADFNQENLENAFKAVMTQTGLKLGQIAQPVRVALTGRTASPGIFDIIEIIGKQNVIQRLKQAIKTIDKLEE